jgi:hypothetical protein
LINRKSAHAALRASPATGQPFAAAAARIRKSSIHDLDQLLVFANRKMGAHPVTIRAGADSAAHFLQESFAFRPTAAMLHC